jgi:hypothetical protein
MTSNFENMTNAELRAYALKHRGKEDIESLRVLFRRRKPYIKELRSFFAFYPVSYILALLMGSLTPISAISQLNSS